jgi:manganese/zinc/iron transport system substrate-binding protein
MISSKLLFGRRGWVALVVMFFMACAAEAAPLRVVSTTGMVNDLVRRIGGDAVSTEVLMGPGVDPHLYKATAADVLKLNRAEVVFYNGLMLEGKMTDVFTRMAKSGKRVHAITEKLPSERLLKSEDYADHPDPHVWFDVELWAACIDVVEARLSEAAPAQKDIFSRNAEATRRALGELHAWAKARAAELPEAKRVLVTSHDAYNYFGRAYGFQVVGLQGISTVSEAALADMAKLTDFIKERGLKAVFVESSVSHATIERIAKDSGVKIGGELFSDAMGSPGQMENGYDVGTYEGMVKHNLNTIVEALK